MPLSALSSLSRLILFSLILATFLCVAYLRMRIRGKKCCFIRKFCERTKLMISNLRGSKQICQEILTVLNHCFQINDICDIFHEPTNCLHMIFWYRNKIKIYLWKIYCLHDLLLLKLFLKLLCASYNFLY